MITRVSVLLIALSASALAQSAEEKANIERLETKYFADYNAGRWDEAAAVETEDFLIVEPDGAETKTRQIARWHSRKEPIHGAVAVSNRKYQRYGDTVIVTADASLSAPGEGLESGTVGEVWVNQNNSWKLADLFFIPKSDPTQVSERDGSRSHPAPDKH